MTESYYTGEAAKPRTMAEHARRAQQTWDRIAALARPPAKGEDREPLEPGQLDALRAAACKGFWFYPCVEAVRGVPR